MEVGRAGCNERFQRDEFRDLGNHRDDHIGRYGSCASRREAHPRWLRAHHIRSPVELQTVRHHMQRRVERKTNIPDYADPSEPD